MSEFINIDILCVFSHMIKLSENDNLNNGNIFLNIQYVDDMFSIYIIGNENPDNEIMNYKDKVNEYCNSWLPDLVITIDIIGLNFAPSEYPSIIHKCFSNGIIISYTHDKCLTVSSSGYMSRLITIGE